MDRRQTPLGRWFPTLDAMIAPNDPLFEHLSSQLNAADAEDLGAGEKTGLPDELAEVRRRRQRIQEALEQARAADEARRRQGIDPHKNPAQVPTTDPDSHVMPNKEGGFWTSRVLCTTRRTTSTIVRRAKRCRTITRTE
jgi:hypothetical protein